MRLGEAAGAGGGAEAGPNAGFRIHTIATAALTAETTQAKYT